MPPVSITQSLKQIANKRDERALLPLFAAILADITALAAGPAEPPEPPSVETAAALAIKAVASPLVKAGAAFTAKFGEAVVEVPIDTDMAALAGSVAMGASNVFVFYVDAAGALTSAMGTEAALPADVVAPVTPATKAAVGRVTVSPTGAPFEGGVTALDDAVVLPNALYEDFTAPFNPPPPEPVAPYSPNLVA